MPVTISHPKPRDWIITVDETNISNGETTVVTIEEGKLKFPKTGRILRVQSELISGDATSITPILSEGSAFNATSILVEAEPGTVIDEAPPEGIPYFLESDTLYHRSNPNTGSNNAIRTRYLIREGWENVQ